MKEKDFSPHLIDSGAQHYLKHTLQKCYEFRCTYYATLFNVAVFTVFVVVSSMILYYCYLTKRQNHVYNQGYKHLRDEEYILSKIKFYQNEQKRIEAKKNESASQIDSLPYVANEFLH